MKAAVLKAFGSPLSIEEVPEPVLGTGEAIVDVVAARVLAYAGDVFSGRRRYFLRIFSRLQTISADTRICSTPS